jgi:exodeoxyribonuclease V alpha subunit
MVHCIPPVELKTCRRAELKAITELATFIKEGNADEALAFLTSRDWLQAIDTPQALVQTFAPRFQAICESGSSPEELLNLFNSFRILTPLRRGAWGTEALNAAFKKHLYRALRHHSFFIAPIMITKNDADLGLFNGEVGLLMRRYGDEELFQEGDYALFSGTEGLRRLPAVTLPQFEYAYCLSVHKSQGSEFGEVALLLPEGSEAFGREVLYTGITRAVRGVTIYSTPEIVTQTVRQPSLRLSGVAERFHL